MNTYLLLLVLGAVIYLCRACGLFLALPASSQRLQDALRYVPVAIFAALVAPSLGKEANLLVPKLVALAVAGLLFRRLHRLELSILAGWALLLLLSQFAA